MNRSNEFALGVPPAVNIEYHHVYAGGSLHSRELSENLQVTELLLRALGPAAGPSTLSVLVDDYSCDAVSTADRERILGELLRIRPRPHFIVWESALASCAEGLVSALRHALQETPSRGLFCRLYSRDVDLAIASDHNGSPELDSLSTLLRQVGIGPNEPSLATTDWALFDRSEDVLLRRDDGGALRYTCAMLTAIWHLARLGFIALPDDAFGYSTAERPFSQQRAVSVLPSRYLRVESDALALLAEARGKRFRKARQRVRHVFH